MTTKLDLPELPSLASATDKQIRYWLGHARAQRAPREGLPHGLSRVRDKYVARVQMAGDQVRLGTYADLAQAAHLVAVAQQRWLDHLLAEGARRDCLAKVASTIPLPDVSALNDEDLLLAAKQCRIRSMTLEPYRGGPRHKAMIPYARERLYLGFGDSREDAEVMARDMQDRLWPAIQSELRTRLGILRKQREAREAEALKEDPYAD